MLVSITYFAEQALVVGVSVGVVGIDLARRNGSQQRLVEELHAEIAAIYVRLRIGVTGRSG